jgi:hypothetical protein
MEVDQFSSAHFHRFDLPMPSDNLRTALRATIGRCITVQGISKSIDTMTITSYSHIGRSDIPQVDCLLSHTE